MARRSPWCNVIEESLAPLLIGQDPARIEALVDLMHRGTMIYGRRGLAMFAISGVEIALWDLLGKARGAPVCELLGGAVRPRMPVYASLVRYGSPAEVAAACRQYVAQGFRALKLHQIDVESVRAAREAVGPEVELMLDTNCPWTPAEAIAMARALAPYRARLAGGAGVAARGLRAGSRGCARPADAPIALGENESTLYGFREIVAHGAADILQPSITKVGGISEFRKIAALAQAANLPVAPHAFYLGPGPRRDPARGRHLRRRHAGGVPHRRARDAVPGAAHRRARRLGRGAHRARPRRGDQRGGGPPLPVRAGGRPRPSCSR